MSRQAKASTPSASSRRGGRTKTGSARPMASSSAARKRRDQVRPIDGRGDGDERELRRARRGRWPPRALRAAAPARPPIENAAWKLARIGAPVAALDGDAVRVHGHVERAHGGAVEEGQQAQHGQARRQRDDAGRQAHEREGRARGAAAADARGAPAGDRHGEDRADGGAGEHDAELAVGEADAVAHRGDARRPGAEDEAVEEEDRGDGAARLLRRAGHARTTSTPRSR